MAGLDRIADSCGYAVPVTELAGERDLLTQWTGRKTPGQLAEYRAERTAVSIDGLPALGWAPDAALAAKRSPGPSRAVGRPS